MTNLSIIEDEHRKKMINIANQIPKEIPSDWESHVLAVGGLMYVGFSEIQSEKLICISSQGQSVINCKTLQENYCDENYDENDLIACAEELGDEIIKIAGDMGGGLRTGSKEGNSLQKIAPYWPKEQIIFCPNYQSLYIAPDQCWNVFDDYGIKAYGFSKCGKYFVIATSSDLTIYKRIER